MNSEITFCKNEDLDELRIFINNHWKKNHILFISKNILDWYYKKNDGSYNFILGKINGEISGILGFIPNSKYDLKLQDKKVVWLALWKVKNNCHDKTLGIKMLSFLKEKLGTSVLAVNGINNNAKTIFNLLGFKTGKLNHYYLFSSYAKTNLLQISEEFEKNYVDKSGDFWNEIFLSDLNKFKHDELDIGFNNLKTVTYLKNKYLKNNFYDYKIFKINGQHNQFGLIILKIIKVQNANIMRIIDYLGNEDVLLNSGKGLDEVMKKYDIEYVDFLNYGFDENTFKSIGFKINNEREKIIIPNYFEPFVFKNLSINFAFKNYSNNEFKLNIFKGDGDQERPNIEK